jgi:SAM-dependent methyltransferase
MDVAANVADPDELLRTLAEAGWSTERLIAHARALAEGEGPYARALLAVTDDCEIMLARWRPGIPSAPHDHGDARGWVFVLDGTFEESVHRLERGELVDVGRRRHAPGDRIRIEEGEIHACVCEGEGITLHVYTPRIRAMRIFDRARRRTLVVAEGGAWIPSRILDDDAVVAIEPWRRIVILHTTRYREGGAKFARAAAQLAEEKARAFPDCTIELAAVETKAEFLRALEGPRAIEELHFLGHSGIYGIMFGTTAWPEQMSPHEWRMTKIPFATGARAYFHACRTARWFAPFFARTFGVRAYGYFWYTTVSLDRDRFVWDAFAKPDAPRWIVSVPGRKSDGILGSLRKFALRPRSFPLLGFDPKPETAPGSYDPVAALYDETFADASVRRAELRWLRRAIGAGRPRILEIGCGTGAFLRGVRDLVTHGDGVDVSAEMLARARDRSRDDPRLAFRKIEGPSLPFPDDSFDVVVSVLSFRYLDWDPIVGEILRVLRPGGRLLVVDMVAAPPKLREWPLVVRDKIAQRATEIARPRYRRALRRMVDDPSWASMLEANPIRAEHEMRWYLGSRFPRGTIEVLDRGRTARILAFDSGPIQRKSLEALSYP